MKTTSDIRDIMPKRARRSKYGNKHVTLNGEKFDSRAEAAYWLILLAWQAQKRIKNLERQVPFVFACGAKYVADFAYDDVFQRRNVVSDIKGVRTPIYKLKRKMMWTEFSIIIDEPTIDTKTVNAMLATKGL